MRFWYNPNFLAIAALVLLAIPALKSLAIPNFYTSHDGETHTARIAQYWQAAADGQIPPRFAPSLYNGLGSPILTYIYPLPYLAGSAVHSLGFSFTDSFEIIMALGFVFSGIFSYLWLKEVFKSEKAAFLGALFYIWVPYRFLLIYVRASISEHLAYTFLPLMFYCLTKLYQKNAFFWIAATALTSSFFLLSQNLVALIFLPIIGGYVLFLGIFSKSLKYLFSVVVAGLWTLSIASITYLPAIFERKFVRFDEVYALTYLGNFVSLGQLVHSPWGYGFSLTGFDDLMSFQVGLTHLLVFGFFLTLLTFKLLLTISSFWPWSRANLRVKSIDQFLVLSIFFGLVVLVTIILMLPTDLTVSIWQHFKPLTNIDYPWRFLGVTTFAISFIVAYIAKTAKPGLIFILLILGVIIANRNHLRINLPANFNDNFFLNYYGTATQLGEFTPKWRQSTNVPIGFDPNVHVESQEGDVMIENVVAKSNKITFTAQVFSDTAKIRINKFYFPGWNVQVDGTKLVPFKDLIITNTTTLALDKEQDSSGLMMVNLQRGDHQVLAHFGETPLRLFANYLSLGSLILALGVIVQSLRRHV